MDRHSVARRARFPRVCAPPMSAEVRLPSPGTDDARSPPHHRRFTSLCGAADGRVRGWPIALIATCVLLAFSDAAFAAPDITLSKSTPGQVLYGTDATVTLTASNPALQPFGYNLSFRDVLPPGVHYVAGSAPFAPRVIADAPSAGFHDAGVGQPRRSRAGDEPVAELQRQPRHGRLRCRRHLFRPRLRLRQHGPARGPGVHADGRAGPHDHHRLGRRGGVIDSWSRSRSRRTSPAPRVSCCAGCTTTRRSTRSRCATTRSPRRAG